jgi:hypothetical protein
VFHEDDVQIAVQAASAVRNSAMNQGITRPEAAAALIVALFALMLAGCSSKPATEQQILGTWESSDATLGLTYQFDREGKCSVKINQPRVSHSTTGHWKLEGRTVVITPEATTYTFDGKPKPAPVGPTEREEIVSLDSSALVLKMRSEDGQEHLAAFRRPRRSR